MTRASGHRKDPVRRALAHLTAFWKQEYVLSVFCAFLLGAIFIVHPLAAMGLLGRFIMESITALILVSGVLAIAEDRRTAAVAAVVAMVSISSRCAAELHPGPVITAWAAAFSVVNLLLLAGVVLAHVFKAGEMNYHRIQGAVAAYLLLGLAWAQAYLLVAVLDPGAFIPPQPTAHEAMPLPRLVYFSFVTLTTVGYGDITPAHPFARSLATFEALVGQLYPAILIARLVSLELHARLDRRK